MIDRIYTLESRCLNFKWKYINPISSALCWNIGNYIDLLKLFKLAVKTCWLCTTTECVIKPKKYFRIVPIVFCCRCQHTIHKVLEQISIVVAFHWELRLIDNWSKKSNKKSWLLSNNVVCAYSLLSCWYGNNRRPKFKIFKVVGSAWRHWNLSLELSCVCVFSLLICWIKKIGKNLFQATNIFDSGVCIFPVELLICKW